MDKKTDYITLLESENLDIPLFLDPRLHKAIWSDDEWDVEFIKDERGLIASWIYFTKKKMGFKYVTMPPLIKYSGLHIFNPCHNNDEIILQLTEKLPSLDDWTQSLYPELWDYQKEWAGTFHNEAAYTYVLYSEPLDTLWNKLDSDYRNNKIKKARKKLTIHDDCSLKDFFEVNAMSFLRQGIDVPYSLDYVKKLDSYWTCTNQRKIFTAKDSEGRIHSVAYLVWDKKTSYLLMAGSDPKLRKSGAGIYLTWEIIRYSFETLGVEKFDFLGSMIPSIEKVRKSFGAKQEFYPQISKPENRLLKMLKTIRDRVS